ncbi:DDB1- and CUL4-associated factor 10 [Chrysoperla carnea]|uniref:DDB1- and CUL4-associated factor 10 n=1 Tax=Chrysoperla carnea TaxID=189513 RepID=UPI001D073DE9|nr:DDB1- and CUL4-associated factor 10 [Chrysoperla carnea]
MTKERSRTRLLNPNWLRDRELGVKRRLGFEDAFSEKLYYSLLPCNSWDQFQHTSNKIHGGVFNLEFSPDGSLLVAACEKKSIIMFDPLNRKVVKSVDYAHGDCVNCVRFLDNRTFATCSDDSTVALWDARNLKHKTRTLQGHSNWVKNIEYSPKDDLLVTSGFDGSIYTWDINSYTESSLTHKRVFHTNGLMRTRLSPNASKMVICTTGGYLILIHDLNLKTLAQDLSGFKPNMYRLMQLSSQTIPVANAFSHLFSPKRTSNRVEFITDFPVGDEAEVVSSLQIHPHGWCCMSRNINSDETSEWTCVHDIQSKTVQEMEDFQNEADKYEQEPVAGQFLISETDTSDNEGVPLSAGTISATIFGQLAHDVRTRASYRSVSSISLYRPPNLSSRETRGSAAASSTVATASGSSSTSTTSPSSASTSNGAPSSTATSASSSGSSSSTATRPARQQQQNASTGEVMTSTDVWEALIAIREARIRRELVNRNPEGNFNFNNMQRISSTTTGILGPNMNLNNGSDNSGDESPTSSPSTSGQKRKLQHRQSKTKPTALVYKNMPRLTHFIEEPNVGKGFIKEQCFSPDGRLICSPFGYGIRLLAFSPQCHELSTCVPDDGPVRLFELGTNMCHSDIVVSSKFSPKHCLLVTGCLSGKIVWHQPAM